MVYERTGHCFIFSPKISWLLFSIYSSGWTLETTCQIYVLKILGFWLEFLRIFGWIWEESTFLPKQVFLYFLPVFLSIFTNYEFAIQMLCSPFGISQWLDLMPLFIVTVFTTYWISCLVQTAPFFTVFSWVQPISIPPQLGGTGLSCIIPNWYKNRSRRDKPWHDPKHFHWALQAFCTAVSLKMHLYAIYFNGKIMARKSNNFNEFKVI